MKNKMLLQPYTRSLSNGYYVVAIQYPHTVVYELISRTSNRADGSYWSGYESCIAKIIAFIPLQEALIALCGESRPNIGAAANKAAPNKRTSNKTASQKAVSNKYPLTWQSGELPKTYPLLVSTPIEFDLIQWHGEEIGWPSYIHHVEGYIPLHDFLRSVADHLTYEPMHEF